MIKDLFSNDFLNQDNTDANNFAKTKYDTGKLLIFTYIA